MKRVIILAASLAVVLSASAEEPDFTKASELNPAIQGDYDITHVSRDEGLTWFVPTNELLKELTWVPPIGGAVVKHGVVPVSLGPTFLTNADGRKVQFDSIDYAILDGERADFTALYESKQSWAIMIADARRGARKLLLLVHRSGNPAAEILRLLLQER